MCSAADLFLRADAPIEPANAVAALLVLDDGRYVMQLRDALPHIFYPAHWSCFGGAVDPGEKPAQALRRELAEELEFQADELSEFTRFDFDFSRMGRGSIYRAYYEARITSEAFERFVLHEGEDMQALEGGDLLVNKKVAPYDAFAIWMHMSRHRFAPART